MYICVYIMIPEELRSPSIFTAPLCTENMIAIYFYRNCYGYYCVGVALVQIPLILEVQYIDNTLK